MNDDDRRQHLENCLRHEQAKYSSDADAFDEMVKDFESKMREVIEASGRMKIGFVKRAKAIFSEGRSQVIQNRVQINEELQRSVLRITAAVIVVYAVYAAFSATISSIDNQFCEFYNVQGRTQRYETQKPCQR